MGNLGSLTLPSNAWSTNNSLTPVVTTEEGYHPIGWSPFPRGNPFWGPKKAFNRTATSVDFVPLDVSDLRDVAGVFHRHPDITHTIHLAYAVGPLVDENTSLSTRVNTTGLPMRIARRHSRGQP